MNSVSIAGAALGSAIVVLAFIFGILAVDWGTEPDAPIRKRIAAAVLGFASIFLLALLMGAGK